MLNYKEIFAVYGKNLGTTLTNKNSITEEIKSRLRSGNAAIIWCRILYLPGFYTNI